MLPCGQFINFLKWSNGWHHPWGLWGDCWFACEHSLDNEEPDWGTAISETFVIFPTGQSPILVTPLTRQPHTPSHTQWVQLGGPGGDNWRWHWCHFGRHSLPRLPVSPPIKRQRRRDTEPQVPTSLADKSNLSPWPLTPEVAMEPSSRGVDVACWDCSQQGGVNMGCCENY